MSLRVVYDNRTEEDKGAASWENKQCGFRTRPTQTDLYNHRKEPEP